MCIEGNRIIFHVPQPVRQALGEKIRMKFCKRLDRGVFIAAADCLDQRIFGLILRIFLPLFYNVPERWLRTQALFLT